MGCYIRYDEDADVLHVQFDDPHGKGGSRDVGGARLVEYDEEGRPVAVEFLAPSDGIDLTGIPRADEIRASLEALGVLISTKVVLRAEA